MPAKPVSKTVTLSSGVGRRATTSSMFAQMHSSLADAFTKPPKQFTARVFILMNFNSILMAHSNKNPGEVEFNDCGIRIKKLFFFCSCNTPMLLFII